MEWKFRIPQDSEVNQDPIEGEFFTTQNVGDFADALVRECIQNSLDAKLKTPNIDKVETRFYFSKTKNSQNVSMQSHPFFKGIYPHLLALDNGINKQDLPEMTAQIRYLLIEDFNTVGLDGSIIENDDPKDSSPDGHNFYWFWRNVGRSGKKGGERGQWGLGKTVFPASSSINSFFGLTNRSDDGDNLLMGLSVLKTHHLANGSKVKRYPYGYFAEYLGSDEFFATPTRDKQIINDFRLTFDIKRKERSDPGLSIVIPFPKLEITSTSVIRSVLKQYFHPIIAGKLDVSVAEQNEAEILISKTSIFDTLEGVDFSSDIEVSKNNLTKLFQLCLWSMNENLTIINFEVPPIDRTTMWRKDWFVSDAVAKTIEGQIIPFDSGKRLAFNVPVKIQERNQLPRICYFKVFLEKDETLNEASSYFVRNGITITGIRKPRNRHIRAIVLVQDEHLERLLGDAENPAHTEWQKNSSHFVGKYTDGEKVISFVEKSIDNICALLLRPAEGVDKDILSDIFFIELEDVDSAREINKGKDEITVPPIIPTFESKKYPFTLTQEKGGFKIISDKTLRSFSGTIKIEIAYMVDRGSPLKKYSKYDFDVSSHPIVVKIEGLEVIALEANMIIVGTDFSSEFALHVSGFDEQRDLFIKANYNDPKA